MAEKSSIERLAERMGVESGGRKVGRTTMVRLSLYYLVVIVIIAGFIVLTGDLKAMEALQSANPNDLASFCAPLLRSLPRLVTGAAPVIAGFLRAVRGAFV